MRPRPRMIKRLCVWLVLGAIVNVGVAWGCFIWKARFPTLATYRDPLLEEIWRNHALAKWPQVQDSNLVGDRTDRFGSSTTTAIVSDGDARAPTTWYVEELRCGVPASCLSAAKKGQIPPGTELSDGGFWCFGKLLPRKILWPGFAINTVFYAAVLWGLFAGFGFVRRRIRARRGQCPACAYPIGTNPLCTECGKPVPKRLGA